MSDEVKILRRKLERERRKREILESEIEEKSRVLYSHYEFQKELFNSLGEGIILCNSSGAIDMHNRKALSYFSDLEEVSNIAQFIGDSLCECIFAGDNMGNHDLEFEIRYLDRDYSLLVNSINSSKDQVIFAFKDITHRKIQEGKIKKLKEKIIESAYKDGVAENAVSVLHNVGNTLTSMINHSLKSEGKEKLALSTQVISNLLKKISSYSHLEDFHSFLAEGSNYDRFQKLLEENVKTTIAASESYEKYIHFVDEKCFQISSVISSQEERANYKNKNREKFDLVELIHDCFEMHKDSFTLRDIKVDFELSDIENIDIDIDKVGMAQVLSNLFMNCIDAFDVKDQSGTDYQKNMEIILTQDNGSFELRVVDNAIGISSELIDKVFNYGFTTKKSGGGFGLHNCANYMKRNLGDISLSSPGENKGTCVTLLCPYNS